MSEIAKVLNAAADLLEKPGAWMQGKSSGVRADGPRCFCTMGAIRHLTGDDLRPEHWDAFWVFYQDTGSRKWGRPYLTRDFFARIGRTMADRIALVMALAVAPDRQ